MAALNDENDSALQAVSPSTTIQALTAGITPTLMCPDSKKTSLRKQFLGYAAIVKILGEKLSEKLPYEAQSIVFAALAKDMRGNPIAEITVTLQNELEFFCQFQNGHLSIGLCKTQYNQVKPGEKEKRVEHLKKIWKSIKGGECLSSIIEELDREVPELKGLDPQDITRGYIARTYTMPMIHLEPWPTMTVGRLTDIMVALAASAEKAAKKLVSSD